jgi:hypothetical protein
MVPVQRSTVDAVPPMKRDWRDAVGAASDLALMGIVTTIAAVPLVTAGAALASASAAVREWSANERLPSLTEGLRRMRRGLLPGLAASLVGTAATVLLLLNGSALARGAVPGGTPILVGTAVAGLLWAGFAGLTIVEVGARDGGGWLEAARCAWRTSLARPWVPAVLGLVVAIGGFLGLVLPFLAPVMVGYVLFALHTTARRLHATGTEPLDRASTVASIMKLPS